MKVKFVEPTFFGGKKYEKDEIYNLKPEEAGALGTSVKILGKKDKEVEEVSEEGVENENKSEETEPQTEKGKGKGKK